MKIKEFVFNIEELVEAINKSDCFVSQGLKSCSFSPELLANDIAKAISYGKIIHIRKFKKSLSKVRN